MSIWLSEYITVFHCFDKHLIVSSATSGGVSIEAVVTVIHAPMVVTSARFSFAFLLITGNTKHY